VIIDQLDGVPDSIRYGKTGFAGLCILCLAGLIAFVLVQQPDQDCFAPPAHNLTSKLVDGCFFAELAAAVVGLVGLFLDRRKTLAALSVGLFLPVFLIDAMAKGCW
jgi:hypothetical protein